ncbi:MAG: rhodanese-like domain-containing protein, partial [Desulfobacterota bacterium]|nr:rhodanese-like domain-containing protein [Thermodesulfobacteriota bacterium]
MGKRRIIESIGIIFFSIGIALLINFYRHNNLPLSHPLISSVDEVYSSNSISLSALREKLKKPGIIILDARSPDEFREGHIPVSYTH